MTRHMWLISNELQILILWAIIVDVSIASAILIIYSCGFLHRAAIAYLHTGLNIGAKLLM